MKHFDLFLLPVLTLWLVALAYPICSFLDEFSEIVKRGQELEAQAAVVWKNERVQR